MPDLTEKLFTLLQGVSNIYLESPKALGKFLSDNGLNVIPSGVGALWVHLEENGMHVISTRQKRMLDEIGTIPNDVLRRLKLDNPISLSRLVDAELDIRARREARKHAEAE